MKDLFQIKSLIAWNQQKAEEPCCFEIWYKCPRCLNNEFHININFVDPLTFPESPLNVCSKTSEMLLDDV